MSHDTQIASAYDPSCHCYRYESVFAPVKDILSGPDITIGNLETTLPGNPSEYSGYPRFGAPASLASALKNSGFDILVTANNHSMDKGANGLRNTIQVLENLEIGRTGTFGNQKDYETNNVLLVEKKGWRISLLNYTYGTNGLEVPDGVFVNRIQDSRIIEDLQKARDFAPDVTIVFYHFGDEYARFPNDFQKKFVELAWIHGADIVIGAHPHVLQPMELIDSEDQSGEKKERFVAYSLGNFVSGQRPRFRDGGIILRLTLEKENRGKSSFRFSSVDAIPVWVHWHWKAGKMKHEVLPATWKSSDLKRLSPASQTKMTRFLSDTESHLELSMKQIREQILKSEQ